MANGRHVATKPHIAIAFIAAMLSMALSPHAALAGVYKCKDAKGKITYSDSPCQTQAAQLPVHGSIQYENSAAGRQAAAASRSEAEIRKIQEVSSGASGECNKAVDRLKDMAGGRSNSVAFARQKMAVDALCGTNGLGNSGRNNVECDRAANKLANMASGGSNSVTFAQQKMVVDAVCGTNGMGNRGHGEDAAGLTNNTGSNQGVGSATRDFDVRMNAKRDYQKQQIPGFITHQPTDAHERGVYKQEMNRQKNIDPNTWNR